MQEMALEEAAMEEEAMEDIVSRHASLYCCFLFVVGLHRCSQAQSKLDEHAAEEKDRMARATKEARL